MTTSKESSDFLRMKKMMYTQHYCQSTITSYLSWVKKYHAYHQKHPRDMGKQEIQEYLSHLACDKKVAKSTQNQAFHALLYLYNKVFEANIQGIKSVRSQKKEKVPMILSQAEVLAFLNEITPASCYRLALLYYTCGLRLMEGVRLRIQDIDFKQGHILIHNGKRDKSRIVPLAPECVPPLQAQITETERIWKRDTAQGFGNVYIPQALRLKYPYAESSWQWQYVFISKRRSIDPRDHIERRQHIHPNTVQKAIERTSRRLLGHKKITPHSLRHSVATHLVEMGKTLKEVSEFLGHSDTRTTEKYIHLARHQKPFFSLADLEST